MQLPCEALCFGGCLFTSSPFWLRVGLQQFIPFDPPKPRPFSASVNDFQKVGRRGRENGQCHTWNPLWGASLPNSKPRLDLATLDACLHTHQRAYTHSLNTLAPLPCSGLPGLFACACVLQGVLTVTLFKATGLSQPGSLLSPDPYAEVILVDCDRRRCVSAHACVCTTCICICMCVCV